jgi:hypothetical protein
VLDVQDDDAFLHARLVELLVDKVREVDEFLAIMRADLKCVDHGSY